MDVSDVLRDRMEKPAGLQRMVVASALGHLALVAIVIVAPADWLSSAPQTPVTLMTISLTGGSPGVDNGGMTQAPGRAVQEVRAADAPKERPTAPAAKTPEMTVPLPGKAKPTAAAPVKEAPDDARARRASRGTEVSPGASAAETQIRGQGFGLSTTSGGQGPGGVQLEGVDDFCCRDYIEAMAARIKEAWNRQVNNRGSVIVRFVIERDGTLRDATVFKSSGYAALDTNALRAVVTVGRITPLPAAFPNSSLGIRLTFEY
jgi:TonB family protein